MGAETSNRILFYCKCTRCDELIPVSLDSVRSGELLKSFIDSSSYCFGVPCPACRGQFIATVGNPKESKCGECEIREHCLTSGSASLYWVDYVKRGTVSSNF